MKKKQENKTEGPSMPKEQPSAAEAPKEPIQDYVEQLQRLQAEFENFKKREEREKQRFRDFARADILIKLLNFSDDFERTASVIEKTDCTSNKQICTIKEGIAMLSMNFQKLLKEEGVEPITCVGHKLDPFRHEVLLQENGKEDGVILEELQKGYLFKGSVLRPSKVKVCKCVEEKEAEETQKEADEKKGVEEFENKQNNPEGN
ncbi:MAG: nucleotide exchange factor GrpE [Nanoarchaeota archaeon]|nr:nucleotide exchange factor GrpE [Nanoarchaeota archaeon]